MDLKLLLQMMVEKGASDLHLRSDKQAVFRVDGNLAFRSPQPIPGEVIEQWVKRILNDHQSRIFQERLECDLAITVQDLGRFRVNIYRQRGLVNVAFRVVASTMPTFEQLKLPNVVKKIADEPRGLIL